MTSLKMTDQPGGDATVQEAVEMKKGEMNEVQTVESSPSSNVDKEWVNNRYVVSTKILTTGGKPGAKWPANVLQGWNSPAVLSSDQALITGDLVEAKKSATFLAVVILLAQPISSAGYYRVQTEPRNAELLEVCSALQTCRTSESRYVEKVDSIGEFRTTTRDTLNRYGKSCNYAKNWNSKQCQ